MIPSNLANVSVSMKGVLLRFVGCGGVVRGLCHGAYMCVCLRSLWDSGRSRVLRSGLASEALRVVLRGFVVLPLPLLTQGQLYAVYLFFTTGGGGSVSLITKLEDQAGLGHPVTGGRRVGVRPA